MPNQNTRNRWDMTTGATMAAYLDDREDELLDAAVTAAALLNFLNRHGLLSAFTRAEVLDFFERRVHQLEGDSGAGVAVGSLRRLAGRSLARLVVDAGEHVAAADGHLHPREVHILLLIVSPSADLPYLLAKTVLIQDSALKHAAQDPRPCLTPKSEIPNISKI
jgi:tellurite resistance protein